MNRPTKVPKRKIPRVYVAGKYSGANAWEIEQNIAHAKRWGAKLPPYALPVIPHTNTAHMDALAPYEFWIEATLDIMFVCDGVLMVPGWENSEGARGEHHAAMLASMPVYIGKEGGDADLQKWAASLQIVDFKGWGSLSKEAEAKV